MSFYGVTPPISIYIPLSAIGFNQTFHGRKGDVGWYPSRQKTLNGMSWGCGNKEAGAEVAIGKKSAGDWMMSNDVHW